MKTFFKIFFRHSLYFKRCVCNFAHDVSQLVQITSWLNQRICASILYMLITYRYISVITVEMYNN